MRKLYATLLLFLIGLMSPNFVVASNYDTDHLVSIAKSLPDYKILESSIYNPLQSPLSIERKMKEF